MASDYDFLPVSNGSGDAALMHVTVDRLTAATIIKVDSVVNVPAKFIATRGSLLATGFLDPTTLKNFKGHTSGADLIIDAFEPGSTDTGDTTGMVIIVKPNTGWANRVAQFIKNSTNFGTPEAVTFGALTATSAVIGGINVSNLVPSGVISAFAGAAAPASWLLCDGSAVSRTTYAPLFAVIGSLYGAGDGSTTFNVPSTKGRQINGLDVSQTEFATLGLTGGQKTVAQHTHAISDPGHAHSLNDPTHNHDLATGVHAGGGGVDHTATGTGMTLNWSDGTRTGTSSTGMTMNGAFTSITVSNAGTGANNMNPYLTTNYIIKV